MKKKLVSVLAIGLTVTTLLTQTCFAAAARITEDALIEAANATDLKTLEKLVRTDETDIVDETVDCTLVMDESTEPYVYDLPTGMMGMQFEADRGVSIMVDTNENIKDNFKELNKELFRMPICRWGGGSANGYNLAKWIVPKSQRQNTTVLKDIGYEQYFLDKVIPDTAPANDTTYGIISWMKLMVENNPDILFDITIPIERQYPEDTVNFCHFCMDPNGSSEWAILRESYGFKKPLPIYSLELGNELYFFETPATKEYEERATKWYIETALKHADAVTAIWPDIKMLGCIDCNSDRGGFEEWNRPIIREMAKAGYKYFAFHLYYSGYELSYTQPWIDATMRIAEEELGPNHGVMLCMTEHAKWGTACGVGRMALQSGLATAQYINRMYQLGFVDFATYHCGFTGTGLGSKWAWVTVNLGNVDKDLVYTSLQPVYKIYTENMGDRIIPLTQQGESPYVLTDNYAYKFSALASAKGKKQLVLFLNNRMPYTDVNVSFNFKNTYTVKKEITFTAPNFMSFAVTKDTMDVWQYNEKEVNIPNCTSYHVPTKTLMCLILESDQQIGSSTVAGEGEVTYTGENKYFTDIDYNWASNEINILADEGIISGEGDGKYNPEALISKADFSALFTKAMNVGVVENTSQVFNDVKPSDWFYNIANTLALKGIVRKTDSFNSDAPIDISDAICMLYTFANGKPSTNVAGYEGTYNWYKNLSSNEKNAFGYAIDNGLLTKLFEHKDFDKSVGITRAEAAALIYRFRLHYGI